MLTGDPLYRSLFVTSETTPYVKLVRKALAKCMTPLALKQAVPWLIKLSKAMMKVIDRDLQKGPINLEDLFTRTTLDIIGEVAFEADLGGLNKKKPIYELIGACGYYVRSFNLRPLMKLRYVMFPGSAWAKNIRANFEQIVSLWHEVAMEIRKRPQIPDGDTTIWSVLKDLKMPGTNDPLPIELLRGEVAFVVVGGMDATGHILAWMCSLLATYPDVQDKIIDELKGRGLYGKDAREVEFEDIGELQYLTAALKETLRLAQVIALSVRRYASKDTTLCGYRIPKGTHVMVGGCNTKVQDPDWEDPDAFKPERWLTGEDLSQKLYFPFGAGDRDCIAQRLAMIMLRFVLVKFISTYSFHLKKGETFESLYTNQRHGVAVRSAEGINVEVQRRF